MRITFLIAVLLVSIIGKSQDTLLFMNGKDRLVEYKDTADLKVVYVIKGKEKSSYVENIFAVGTAAGRIYFYKQDTLVDDDYSVEQMEQYQLGKQKSDTGPNQKRQTQNRSALNSGCSMHHCTSTRI